MAQSQEKTALHAELLKETAHWNENKELQSALGGLVSEMHEELQRTVATSEVLKAMDVEQAQRAQAYHFKSKVAAAIGGLQIAPDDPMNAVKEQLLREIAKRDALDAEESEQYRRTIEAFKDEVNNEVRRSVASKEAENAVAVETAQRITRDRFHEIGEQLRKTVSQKEADAAMEVEKSQRIQSDFFKKMVLGHLSTNQANAQDNGLSNSLRSELLKEIASPRATPLSSPQK